MPKVAANGRVYRLAQRGKWYVTQIHAPKWFFFGPMVWRNVNAQMIDYKEARAAYDYISSVGPWEEVA